MNIQEPFLLYLGHYLFISVSAVFLKTKASADNCPITVKTYFRNEFNPILERKAKANNPVNIITSPKSQSGNVVILEVM